MNPSGKYRWKVGDPINCTDPFVPFFWVLVINLFLIIFYFFCLFIFLPLLFSWGGLGYIFGCDLISYGLTLLSLWICFLMVLATESIFRLGYFSGFFLFVVLVLTIIFTFRRISILSIYIAIQNNRWKFKPSGMLSPVDWKVTTYVSKDHFTYFTQDRAFQDYMDCLILQIKT
jgi:hypothetical protein